MNNTQQPEPLRTVASYPRISVQADSVTQGVDALSEGSELSKRPNSHVRVLTLTSVDITLGKLLKGMLTALNDEGYISEAACADGTHARELREEGFIVHRIPFRRRVLSLSHIRSFYALYRLLKKRKYDIIHVHTPTAQVIGRLAARVCRVPVVFYTSHGFQFHESRPFWARLLIVWVERLLARWTDIVFTQSQEDATTAIEKGIGTREKVLWIGNGISMEQFTPGPEDPTVREEFSIHSDAKVIAFVGRIVREKGILELVEAMAQIGAAMPHARLLIIGDRLNSDGDVKAKGLLLQALKAHNIEHLVRFSGLRNDVPRLLRAADLMVLPSWREGMPRSVIEAMALGLPVVATDIRGCREEIVHGETGLLVPPRNAGALANAILEVLADSKRACDMGREGRKRALSLFDEAKVVERQLRVYRTYFPAPSTEAD